MSCTGLHHICSYSWLCVGTVNSFSNSSSHSVPHKTVQKVCLMLWISQMACSAHLRWIISGTVQGWNQWHSRFQDGFCFIPHPQDTYYLYIFKSQLLHLDLLNMSNCNVGKRFLFLCYCKAIQVKQYEYCWYFDPIFAWNIIACNNQPFTRTLHIYYSNCNSAVRCSTHGTDVLYLPHIDQKSRHHPVPEKEVQNVCASY